MRYCYCPMPWDLPPIAPLDLPAFLAQIKTYGFDGISLVANLWAQDKLDTTVLPHAQAVRAAGMGLLLRVVASAEHCDWVPRACRLDGFGLNPYHPRAKGIMRRLCEEVRETKLHECATAVTVGWSSSWEATAMEMPRDVDMTPAEEQTARDAVRTLIGTAVSVFGNKKPIGGQRSSLRHIPEQRLETPPYYRETLNVVEDAWWEQREHLPQSIALQKALMPGRPMINGFDVDGWNGWNKDCKWGAATWQDEMLARFRILAENGIAAQVIHISPADLLANAATFEEAGRVMQG